MTDLTLILLALALFAAAMAVATSSSRWVSGFMAFCAGCLAIAAVFSIGGD